MHTRRFGAFIIGMWLMGSLVVWFATAQADLTVERIFTSPPPQMQKEINDMGLEVSRQVFRYQSNQFVRRLKETWEVIQLGLGGALLATSILTTHRSRVVILATVILMILAATQAFYLTPLMNGLARSYDFLPATANMRERENFAGFALWHRVAEVFKILLTLVITSRLMFDFYDFGALAAPFSKAPKKRRRRKEIRARKIGPSGEVLESGIANAASPLSAKQAAVQADEDSSDRQRERD